MHYNPYGRASVLLGLNLVNQPPTSAKDLGRRCAEAGVFLQRVPTAADRAAVGDFSGGSLSPTPLTIIGAPASCAKIYG